MENENKNLNDLFGEETVETTSNEVETQNQESNTQTEIAGGSVEVNKDTEDNVDSVSTDNYASVKTDENVVETDGDTIEPDFHTQETTENIETETETTETDTTETETTETDTTETEITETETTVEKESVNAPVETKPKESDKKPETVNKNPLLSIFMCVLAVLSFATMVGLIFTPFFNFSSKKIRSGTLAPSRIFDDTAKDVKGWYLDETAYAIFFILLILILVSLVLLFKAIVGFKKLNKNGDVYSQKVVFTSLIVCATYFLASLVVGAYCETFWATKNSRIYFAGVSVIPFIVAMVLYTICGVVKRKIKEETKDEFYFHTSVARKFAFGFTLAITIALIIFAISCLAEETTDEALLLIPFSIFICVLLCARFKIDINKQEYLDYLLMKKKMNTYVPQTTKDETVTKTNEETVETEVEVKVVIENNVKEKLLDVMNENYESVIYREFTSVNELVEDFIEFASTKGIDVDREDANSLFSAMASSRAVWINGPTEYLKTLLDALKQYLGLKEGVFELDELISEEIDVIKAHYEKDGVAYNLVEELYRANNNPNSVNVSVFSGVSGKEIDKLFASFIKYFRAPNYGDTIDVSCFGDVSELSLIKENKLVVPANWWCFFINEDKNNVPTLNSEQYLLSISIKDQLPIEPVELEKEFSPIAFRNLLEVIGNAVDKHFVSLDVWNKFDKVVDFLKSISDLSVSNHIYRQIETYSAVLISCGDDNVKALDNVLANKIIPLFAKCNRGKKADMSISECVDNVFGLDNTPLSAKAITDLGLDA